LAILEKGGKNIPFNRPGLRMKGSKLDGGAGTPPSFFLEVDPYFLMCRGLVFNAVR